MYIRKATMADLEAIATIEAACFPPAEAASKDSFATRLAVFADYFWLVEEQGILVGFINGAVINEPTIDDKCYANAHCHQEDGAYQTVFGINTLPQYRKQGIGEAMLHAIIDDARAQGRKGCILTCKDYILQYYEKFGFRSRGVSQSSHGGAIWNDMILEF